LGNNQGGVRGGYLLASASRDHLIQIYDSNNNYEPIQIIEEHSSTVTSVRFVEEQVIKDKKYTTKINLISGGTDKLLLKHTF